MASEPSTVWQVLPHGPIEVLAENLWRVQGSLRGMSLKRVMTIARMTDGSLVLHSPIALEEDAMVDLEALGTPAFLIVPSRYHRLDAPAYLERYPKLRVFAPLGSMKHVSKLVRVDGSYQDFAKDDGVQLEPLQGVGDLEGLMKVHSHDGVTVVLNDIVFNMPRKRDPLGWFFTTLLGSAPGPRISRLTKLSLVKDHKALRKDLERLAATPNLTRLIVAHEDIATGPAAPSALRKAAAYLE